VQAEVAQKFRVGERILQQPVGSGVEVRGVLPRGDLLGVDHHDRQGRQRQLAADPPEEPEPREIREPRGQKHEVMGGLEQPEPGSLAAEG
jgi:hypothetical protein